MLPKQYCVFFIVVHELGIPYTRMTETGYVWVSQYPIYTKIYLYKWIQFRTWLPVHVFFLLWWNMTLYKYVIVYIYIYYYTVWVIRQPRYRMSWYMTGCSKNCGKTSNSRNQLVNCHSQKEKHLDRWYFQLPCWVVPGWTWVGENFVVYFFCHSVCHRSVLITIVYSNLMLWRDWNDD